MKFLDFTEDEIKVLEKEGFKRITITSNEFRKTYDDGDYESVLKAGDDEYEFHYDVNFDGATDLDRANGNFSHYNLTWVELLRDFLLAMTFN